MATKPILFSGPMVRAILTGQKSQTRRVVKPQPHDVGYPPNADVHDYCIGSPNMGKAYYKRRAGVWNSSKPFFPTYKEGDTLWVRETWAHDAPSLAECRKRFEDGLSGGLPYGPYFRADPVHENTGLRWRPSIFMPKWACRLFLEVVNVRVERLQNISGHDALNEGVNAPETSCDLSNDGMHSNGWYDGDSCSFCGDVAAVPFFADLWDSLNAKRGFGWDVNPWVWVYEFNKVERPQEWPVMGESA